MEVTQENFQEVLEEIKFILKEASFLAIDGEFTGLNSGVDVRPFDTPTQFYNKIRSTSMEFLMIQFGLAVFTHDPQTKKYSQRSYNFYAFPRPLNKDAPDCRFMCQSSSITFLANHGFDFNKLFNSGIPYLTTTEEERLNKKFEERQKVRQAGLEKIPISDDDKPQIEEICSRIEEFLSSEAEEITIERCNAYIRRLIHQESRLRWPKKLHVEAKNDEKMSLTIRRMGTKQEEKQKEEDRRDKEKQEIKDAVGLTTLFRIIADSGKLIVGHNMLLDLCHMVHQFFGPLPDSYEEFKLLIHNLFPRLLDTKMLCQSPQFKDKIPSSILNAVLDTISKAPFSIPDVTPIEGRSYDLSSEKRYHEAGYDAYVTGLCAIACMNNLGVTQQSESAEALADSPLLDPFINRLLVNRLKDFPYISLTESDPNPSRDHVFHLTFPKEWKTSDLTQLFSKFGGVYVSWLNDTSAYVSLNQRNQLPSAMKFMRKNKGNKKYTIQTYKDFQKTLGESIVPVKNNRKRKSPTDVVESEVNAPTEKESDGSDDTNNQDDGWETASGKKRQKRKVVVGSSNAGKKDAANKTFAENATWE